jgi:hypothetical protein
MLSISKKLIRVLSVVIQLPLFLLPFTVATLIPTVLGGMHFYGHISRPAPALASIEPHYLGDVLAENTELLTGNIGFNIPAIFNEQVSIKKNLEVGGESTFSGNIRVLDKNVDAGKGNVYAANLLYGVLPGAGISISAGQTPTITNTGVVSIGGKKGELKLEGGSGISVDGTKITNTGITSLTAGSGISVSGSTITNTDKGSDQRMFKYVNVYGQSILEASNSIDTVILKAGTGITLSADSGEKSVTINSSSGDTIPGWTDGGSAVYLTTTSDKVGIGTSSPAVKLHVVGDGVNAAAFMSGNVGIGTTAPNAQLHVASDAQIDGGLSVGFAGDGQDDRLYVGDANYYFDLGNAIAGSALIGFDSNDYLEYNRAGNRYSFFVGGTEMTRIDSSALYANVIRDVSGGNDILQDDAGNVGIGTTAPGAKLHVAGNGTTSAVFSSGNVGIGTTSPGNTLDVVGGIKVTGLTSGSGSALCLDGSNNIITCVTGAGGLSGSGAVNQLAFFDTANSVTSDSNLYWNNTTKQFGIGTTAPTVRLQVQGDGTYSGVFMGGNVGIGTTAPGYQLHVVGNGYISGQISAGSSSVTLTTTGGYIDADA